jgi:glycosyltransferase involved in cell wall biosynthesis
MAVTVTSKPKVSICLPVFNGAAYLKEAIESALAQTFSDFELLIADDGSRDASVEIAQRYAAIDPRIIFWTNTKRLGLFANYNACMAKARGTYIKLFAQDDLIEPNTVDRMVEVLDNYPNVTLVSGGKSLIDQSGKETKRIIQFPDNRFMQGKDVVIAHLIVLGNWVGEPSVVMFRAQDLGSGFDQSYYHYGDIEYWFRLLDKGELFYISDVLCKFRCHADSTTTRNLGGLYFAIDILRLGERYKNVLAELGESTEHFFKRAVETIALNVDHLVRNEGVDINRVIAAGLEPSESESPGGELSQGELRVVVPALRPLTDAIAEGRHGTVSDNEIMRQGMYYFSRRITELLEELIVTKNELEHRQAECERLWQAVNQMTNSVSWRLTAPLRNVREKMNHRPTRDGSRL